MIKIDRSSSVIKCGAFRWEILVDLPAMVYSWVETPRDQTDKVIQLKTYGYHDMVLKSWKTPSYHPSYTLLSFHEGQTNWLPKKGHICVTA